MASEETQNEDVRAVINNLRNQKHFFTKKKEVELAIKNKNKLSNRKAVGSDSIMTEMLKNVGEGDPHILLNL